MNSLIQNGSSGVDVRLTINDMITELNWSKTIYNSGGNLAVSIPNGAYQKLTISSGVSSTISFSGWGSIHNAVLLEISNFQEFFTSGYSEVEDWFSGSIRWFTEDPSNQGPPAYADISAAQTIRFLIETQDNGASLNGSFLGVSGVI